MALDELFRWTITTDYGSGVFNNPQGWDKIELSLMRDKTYTGLFHKFTVPIKFYNSSGKELVDQAYLKDGLQANGSIVMEVKCRPEDGYRELFTGRFNFDSYEREGPFTEVNIEPDGIGEKLKAREDIKIDLNTTESIGGVSLPAMSKIMYDLNMHSQTLVLGAEYYQELPYETQTTEFFHPFEDNQFNRRIQHAMFVRNAQIREMQQMASFQEAEAEQEDSLIDPFFVPEIPGFLSYPATFDVDYHFAGEYLDEDASASPGRRGTNGNPLLLLFAWGPEVGNLQYEVLGFDIEYDTDITTFTTNFDYSGSFSFNMNSDDRAYLFWYSPTSFGFTNFGVSGTIRQRWTYTDMDLNISTENEFVTTKSKASAIHEAFARTCEAITDDTDIFVSNYFGRTDSEPRIYPENGCGAFTALASGLHLRQFTETAKPFKVSLKDLFDGANAIWGLALGVERDASSGKDVIRLEDKLSFFENRAMAKFINVEGMSMQVAKDMYWNRVPVGYKMWDAQDLNALDEFNGWHEYANLIDKANRSLDLRSDFVASGYATEITRRFLKDLFPDETTDYDNETFVLCLNNTVDGGNLPTEMDETEQAENFPGVSGIKNFDDTYNLRISPKRNFLRHLNWISGGLLFKPGSLWKFTEFEASDQLVSRQDNEGCPGDFTGANLSENQDIAFDNTNARLNIPIFIPEYYTFEHKMTFSIFQDIWFNTKGYVIFSETSCKPMTGWIIEMNYKHSEAMAKFKVIRRNDGF